MNEVERVRILDQTVERLTRQSQLADSRRLDERFTHHSVPWWRRPVLTPAGGISLRHVPYQPDRSDEDDHDPWHARFPESLDDAYAKYLSEARGALILTANDGTRMPTELIRHRGSWRGHDDVECATMDYVDWFNHGRLHVALGMVPLAEYEAAHCHHVVPDNLAASQ